MAAHIRRVDMRDRHIQPPPHARDLFGRGHNRIGVIQQFAHRIAAGRMPQRAVFELSGLAHHSTFSITFDVISTAKQLH